MPTTYPIRDCHGHRGIPTSAVKKDPTKKQYNHPHPHPQEPQQPQPPQTTNQKYIKTSFASGTPETQPETPHDLLHVISPSTVSSSPSSSTPIGITSTSNLVLKKGSDKDDVLDDGDDHPLNHFSFIDEDRNTVFSPIGTTTVSTSVPIQITEEGDDDKKGDDDEDGNNDEQGEDNFGVFQMKAETKHNAKEDNHNNGSRDGSTNTDRKEGEYGNGSIANNHTTPIHENSYHNNHKTKKNKRRELLSVMRSIARSPSPPGKSSRMNHSMSISMSMSFMDDMHSICSGSVNTNFKSNMNMNSSVISYDGSVHSMQSMHSMQSSKKDFFLSLRQCANSPSSATVTSRKNDTRGRRRRRRNRSSHRNSNILTEFNDEASIDGTSFGSKKDFLSSLRDCAADDIKGRDDDSRYNNGRRAMQEFNETSFESKSSFLSSLRSIADEDNTCGTQKEGYDTSFGSKSSMLSSLRNIANKDRRGETRTDNDLSFKSKSSMLSSLRDIANKECRKSTWKDNNMSLETKSGFLHSIRNIANEEAKQQPEEKESNENEAESEEKKTELLPSVGYIADEERHGTQRNIETSHEQKSDFFASVRDIADEKTPRQKGNRIVFEEGELDVHSPSMIIIDKDNSAQIHNKPNFESNVSLLRNVDDKETSSIKEKDTGFLTKMHLKLSSDQVVNETKYQRSEEENRTDSPPSPRNPLSSLEGKDVRLKEMKLGKEGQSNNMDSKSYETSQKEDDDSKKDAKADENFGRIDSINTKQSMILQISNRITQVYRSNDPVKGDEALTLCPSRSLNLLSDRCESGLLKENIEPNTALMNLTRGRTSESQTLIKKHSKPSILEHSDESLKQDSTKFKSPIHALTEVTNEKESEKKKITLEDEYGNAELSENVSFYKSPISNAATVCALSVDPSITKSLTVSDLKSHEHDFSHETPRIKNLSLIPRGNPAFISPTVDAIIEDCNNSDIGNEKNESQGDSTSMKNEKKQNELNCTHAEDQTIQEEAIIEGCQVVSPIIREDRNLLNDDIVNQSGSLSPPIDQAAVEKVKKNRVETFQPSFSTRRYQYGHEIQQVVTSDDLSDVSSLGNSSIASGNSYSKRIIRQYIKASKSQIRSNRHNTSKSLEQIQQDLKKIALLAASKDKRQHSSDEHYFESDKFEVLDSNFTVVSDPHHLSHKRSSNDFFYPEYNRNEGKKVSVKLAPSKIDVDVKKRRALKRSRRRKNANFTNDLSLDNGVIKHVQKSHDRNFTSDLSVDDRVMKDFQTLRKQIERKEHEDEESIRHLDVIESKRLYTEFKNIEEQERERERQTDIY